HLFNGLWRTMSVVDPTAFDHASGGQVLDAMQVTKSVLVGARPSSPIRDENHWIFWCLGRRFGPRQRIQICNADKRANLVTGVCARQSFFGATLPGFRIDLAGQKFRPRPAEYRTSPLKQEKNGRRCSSGGLS